MTRVRECLLLLWLAVVCVAPAAAVPCPGSPAPTARFTVYLVPRQPATMLYHDWAPLLARIGEERGLCFDITVPDGFASFERALREGVPDLALMNPYHQVLVARSPGYLPLVRDEGSAPAGVLVVPRDSPIVDLHQLEGRTVAFPAPNAYVASLLLRAHLATQELDFDAVYVGSHANVFRAVALGIADAGGAATTTLDRESTALRSQLRVVLTTPSYVPHPFSAHPRVPEEIREALVEGFLALRADPDGRALLAGIQIEQPVRADYARDYRELEALGLERLVLGWGAR